MLRHKNQNNLSQSGTKIKEFPKYPIYLMMIIAIFVRSSEYFNQNESGRCL